MLCLRCSILSFPTTSPFSPLRRILSAAAPDYSPIPSFAVDEYLVETCGLTRAQALKASTKLSHLKSFSKTDAVLAFLVSLGLSCADVTSIVAKNRWFLYTGVERTLAPVVSGLTKLGLPRPKIARLVSLVGKSFRIRSTVPRLEYYLHLFGSFENLFRTLRRSSYFLGYDLEKMVKPIVVLPRECRLDDCDVAKLFIATPRLLTTNHESIQDMVAGAELQC